jgi:hypothetical protein
VSEFSTISKIFLFVAGCSWYAYKLYHNTSCAYAAVPALLLLPLLLQIIATALQVICNCVTAPPALAYMLCLTPSLLLLLLLLQIIATALQVICNCVTAPPALAYLLPAPGSTASGAAAAAAADKPLEAHQTPQPGEPPTQADVAVRGTHLCQPLDCVFGVLAAVARLSALPYVCTHPSVCRLGTSMRGQTHAVPVAADSGACSHAPAALELAPAAVQSSTGWPF